MSTFHNPYHFVPVKKEGRSDDVGVNSFPANRKHVTHDRFVPATYSGRIICRLTTETPVFVGGQRTKEGSAEAPAEVKHFELEGSPAIPASSLRGLVSSIAEAASNSALRILQDAKYSYRRIMDPSQSEMYRPLSAIGMVIVVRDERGNEEYRLRPLTLPLTEFREGQPASLASHWGRMFSQPNLKVYIGDAASIRSVSFPYETFSYDRERYYGLKLKKRNWANGVQGLLARDGDMNIKGGRFLVSQLPLEDGNTKRRDSQPKPWNEIPDEEKSSYTRGVLRVLGCDGERSDIPNTKKHELFIPYPESAENWLTFPIQAGAIERFYDLADQRTEASDEESLPWPYEPKGTRRNQDEAEEGRRFRLKNGDLVWFRPAANAAEIAEISLSSIWRGRVETSDGKAASTHAFFEKIDSNLLPFNPNRTAITIAEQLFGFVESEKNSKETSALALAGRTYFSHAHFEGLRSPSGADGQGVSAPYMEPVTLRILDTPKPPSPALYFKKTAGNAGYIAKRELRPGAHSPQGRKVYLHHRNREINQPTNEPWRSRHTNPNDKKSRLKQKVRITPLKSSAVFYFHLDFDNLSTNEVGLLLYALRPSNQFRHKIGMGKPLGLGSIHIEPVALFHVERQKRYSAEALFAPRYSQVWLAAGEDRDRWPAQYAREKSTTAGPRDIDELRAKFVEGMDSDIKAAIELLGNPNSANAPVHTPLTDGDDPEDETFKWFVANDQGSGRGPGRIRPREEYLKPLTKETTFLPTLSIHPWAD